MPAKPITFCSVDYPSHTALGEALGLTRAAVHWAVKNDKLHRLGRGPSPPKTTKGMGGRCLPVAAHGWYWHSQIEAAAALGRSPSAVNGALMRGTFEKLVFRVLGSKPTDDTSTDDTATDDTATDDTATNAEERNP